MHVFKGRFYYLKTGENVFVDVFSVDFSDSPQNCDGFVDSAFGDQPTTRFVNET